MKLLILLALAANRSWAQTAIVGDAWIAGKLSVGTTTQGATLEVLNGTTMASAFQVSGVDETPFFQVASSGAVGVGGSPLANLDVSGSGDSGAIALQLHGGNASGSSWAYQLAFGYNGSANLRHGISTTHSTSTTGGSMNFLLWSSALGISTAAVGTFNPFSLVTSTSVGSVHVMPSGTPRFELVVSNGSGVPGGGTVHRRLEAQHSSRALKTDIVYLDEASARAAYEDVKALKHAQYRYRALKRGKLVDDKKQPLHRGLILEDAPQSIKGPHGTLIFDARLVNAELAAQELIRRLDKLDAEASR